MLVSAGVELIFFTVLGGGYVLDFEAELPIVPSKPFVSSGQPRGGR